MRSQIHRIRERTALTRQVQQFFHMHLLGLYRWDQAHHHDAIPVVKTVDFTKKRAERESARDQRKFHDIVSLTLDGFELIVKGPYEDEKHPCGLIRVSLGAQSIEGPLDETTWRAAGEFIKQRKEERDGARPSNPAVNPGTDPAADLRARAPWGC
jgi:hypothetical protein